MNNRRGAKQTHRIMLDILAQGKKPEGAARRPTQTAQALAGYLLTLTSPKKLTLREAAAILDRDVRSVKTAVGALKGYGVSISIVDDFIKFFPDTAAPIRTQEPELDFLEAAPTIQGELVEFDAAAFEEPVEDQLSLFGGYYQAQPKAVSYADFPIVAACSVRQPREQKNKIPVPETDAAAQDLRKPCANFVQSLNKPCTELAEKTEKPEKTEPEPVKQTGAENAAADVPERLRTAMQRLSETFAGLSSGGSSSSGTKNINAQAGGHAPVTKEKQEINLNQSPKVPLNAGIIKERPKFNAAERKKRKAEILQRLPTLNTAAAEHVVGTLANMMAFGTMPESVFYQTLRDAAEPTIKNKGAFMNFKVQKLKKIYRYKK